MSSYEAAPRTRDQQKHELRVAPVVVGVICKSDGSGGVWRLYLHDDGRTELLYPAAPRIPSRALVGRIDLYQVPRYLRESGIGEDGWQPE